MTYNNFKILMFASLFHGVAALILCLTFIAANAPGFYNYAPGGDEIIFGRLSVAFFIFLKAAILTLVFHKLFIANKNNKPSLRPYLTTPLIFSLMAPMLILIVISPQYLYYHLYWRHLVSDALLTILMPSIAVGILFVRCCEMLSRSTDKNESAKVSLMQMRFANAIVLALIVIGICLLFAGLLYHGIYTNIDRVSDRIIPDWYVTKLTCVALFSLIVSVVFGYANSNHKKGTNLWTLFRITIKNLFNLCFILIVSCIAMFLMRESLGEPINFTPTINGILFGLLFSFYTSPIVIAYSYFDFLMRRSITMDEAQLNSSEVCKGLI